MPVCQDCGTDVPGEAKFCPNCGSELAARAGAGGDSDGWGVDPSGDDRAAGDDWGADSGWDESGGGWDDDRRDAADDWNPDAGGAFDDRSLGDEPEGPIPTADPVDETPETDPDGPSPFDEGVLSFAAGYSAQEDYEPILIGSLIEFAGSFIPFIGLIVRGYGMRLCRGAARGQASRPEFDDYGDMFLDGLKLLGHTLAFGLAWLIGGGLLAAVAFAAHETAGALVLFGVFLVGAYLWPASITAFAATDSFGAAFSPTYAGAFATSGTYLKATLLALVLSGVYLFALVVSIFTIIGMFVLLAWGTYFYFGYWGYFYREAVAAGDVPPAPADPV